MAKRRSAMSEESLRRAVVVCGYNEVGQQLCSLLDKANIAGIPYVAFARDATTITAGIKNGARVIYGDGASGALIKAAGVEVPTAIAVVYNEFDRCLRATSCLRDAFPDTPIFVRSDRRDSVADLIKAGATEVVVATGSVASGMGQLLGVRRDLRFGGLMDDSAAAVALRNMAFPLFPPVTQGDEDTILSGIADEIDMDKDPEEIRKLYKLFSTSLTLNEDGQVQLSELVYEMLRTSDITVNDEELVNLLGCNSLDDKCLTEEEYISFSDFISLYRQNRALGRPNI